MKDPMRSLRSFLHRGVLVVALFAVATALAASERAIMKSHGSPAKQPDPAEFGLGPRASAEGLFLASLEPEQALRPRQMQQIRVVVTDREGRAVEGADLTIDGGMPQHGHGLPTRPRVTQGLGDGAYRIEGVRFNMGGWWELKVTIAAGGVTDTVTFNLDL